MYDSKPCLIAHIHEKMDIEYLMYMEIVWFCWTIKHGSGRGSGGQSPPEAEAFWLIK